MQQLVSAGLLPEPAGHPVKVWAHISLTDLMVLDGSSALLQEWSAVPHMDHDPPCTRVRSRARPMPSPADRSRHP
jgi:hypothetical protein